MWKTLLAGLTLTLLSGGTVHAAPPRDGLCEGIRNAKRYSDCLYNDLDERLRALESPSASPSPSPSASPTPSASPSPTVTPTSPPPASGDWLSGAAGSEAADGSFGTWRGRRVEIGTFWVDHEALYPIGPDIAGCGGCGEWANFTGPVNISAVSKSWQGWAAEANGANDAYWAALARKARDLRAGKGQVYINPYYEFNGDWMPYSVTRTTQGQADFRRAFERTSATLRREFPGVKVVLNPAAGRTLPTEMRPALTSFDVLGIDTYNEWPFCGSTSCTSTQLNRVEVLRQQALAWGKPIAFPEWGNASSPNGPGGGGESPAFIDAFHGYMKQHAGTGPGQVVFDTYFNIGGYPARFELYLNGTVNPLQPQTAARYRDRF